MNDNEKFGIELANFCFKYNIKKIPFALNEEQYNSFIKQWNILMGK